MALATVADLIEMLRGSKLLDAAHQQELERMRGQHSDARSLSRELIQRGFLTPYQVNQIMQGHGGELVLGNYTILERLGSGGMGQVLKAQHRELKKIVALKVMRREHVANPEAIHRFRREIRVASQLQHPNIVLVLDADQVADKHFFAMEYVDGMDLSHRVKKNGPLPIAEACEYMRQAAMGLQHAQKSGLVHRDIKPGNLLLTHAAGQNGYGTVKLLDMGLARINSPDDDVASWHTQEGKVLGTPDYMAPEQALKSSAADVRADLYSLGCTFYYLLTASVPFPGGTLMEKLLRHRLDDPEPVEKLRPEVPASVRGILRKLLSKKPDERFQTPAELVQALQDPLRWNALAGDSSKQAIAAKGAHPLPQAIPLDSSPSGPSISVRLASLSKQGLELARKWPRASLAAGGVLFLLFLLIVFSSPGDADPKKKEVDADSLTVEFQAIADRARAPGANFEEIRDELIDFRIKHPATPEARDASYLLFRQLRSPLDTLGTHSLDPSEKTLGMSSGDLVAVLGEQKQRHWGRVRAVALDPKGGLLASGGSDQRIRLWDPSTMKPVGTLSGHSSGVRKLAFAPGGQLLVSAGSSGGLRLWRRNGFASFNSGAQAPIDYRGYITTLAFNPKGTYLAVGGSDANVWVWNLDDSYYQLPGHGRYVTSLSFSPTGNGLASTDGNSKLYVWELGNEVTRRHSIQFEGLRAAAYVADDLLLLGHFDGTVRLLSLAGDEPTTISTSKRRNGIVALAVDSDKRMAVTAESDGGLTLWDLSNRRLQVSSHLEVGPEPVADVALAVGARFVATGSPDTTVRIFSISSKGRLQERFPLDGHTSRVLSLAASPRGNLLASSGFADASVRLWSLVPPLRALSQARDKTASQPYAVAFSMDGGMLAAGGADRVIHRWQIEGTQARALAPLRGHTDDVTRLAYSPVDNTLASASRDGSVRIWKGDQSIKLSVKLDQRDRFVGLSFNASGTMLAVARYSGSIVVWDLSGSAPRLKTEFTVSAEPVRSLTFSPIEAHKLLIGGEGGHVTFWDVEKQRPEEIKFLSGHQRPVTALAFNPSGALLASADEGGGLVVWQFTPERKLKDHKLPGGVNALAFSIDGRYLATGNDNGSIYLFRVRPAPVR